MIEFQQSPTGETGVLTLGGDWPPTRAEELRTALADALGRTEHLVVRLADVQAVSLPFYQLLLAADRTARADGKRLSLEGPFPDAIVQGAGAMGLLSRADGAGSDLDRSLFAQQEGR